MNITINETDRFNFNPGSSDLASGIPDNFNARFAQLGWTRSFTTYGKIEKRVVWLKGEVESSTTIFPRDILRDR